MAEITGADNYTKYRSYIQRRRANSGATESAFNTIVGIEKKDPDLSDEAGTARIGSESIGGFFYNQFAQEKKSDACADTFKESASYASDSRHAGPPKYSRRTDTAEIYRRLYGRGRKKTGSLAYSSSYNSSVYADRAAIEDNRATVLAIKIIKQAIACFVILGIIVFLQQREDTAEVLAFVKRQVVDNHIDAGSLLSGAKNIFNQCARFLGGSP